MKERVLITGASGFVGYHLIQAALEAGLEVFAAVRKRSDVRHLKDFAITYVYPDFHDPSALKSALEDNQYHYIIHASGITKAKSRKEYDEVNADYTRNLALAARDADLPLKKFVFVSSLAALGPLKDLSGLIADDTAGNPVTNYGASKLLAEQYLREIKDLPWLVIRPTAVYGPREKDIFILLQSINKGLEPHIGSFRQQISFIYVKDLARVIVDALKAGAVHTFYNVSDGRIYDRYALAEGVKRFLHKKTFKFHLPVPAVAGLASVMEWLYRNSAAAPALNKEKMNELTAVNWACSIDGVQRDLAFQPEYDLDHGLAETLQWYQQHNWL